MLEGGSSELNNPKFLIKILESNGNGIDLGNYKAGISKLFHDLFPEDFDPEEVDRIAQNEWEAVVMAFDGEKMIGYGSVGHLKEGNMELLSAFVEPQYRRQKVYTHLLEERIKFAKERGASTVTIQAIKSNVAKFNYINQGFIEISDSDAVGEILYKKTII